MKTASKAAAAVAVALSLAACGSLGKPDISSSDQAAVTGEIRIESDPHMGHVKLMGPTIVASDNLFGDTYSIRSWIAPGKPELDDSFQIYVSSGNLGWRFLSTAYSQGKALSTTVISREVVSCGSLGCVDREVVGINFTEDELRQYAKSGITFKVVGKRGSLTMTVPGPYISAMLAAHDRERASLS